MCVQSFSDSSHHSSMPVWTTNVAIDVGRLSMADESVTTSDDLSSEGDGASAYHSGCLLGGVYILHVLQMRAAGHGVDRRMPSRRDRSLDERFGGEGGVVQPQSTPGHNRCQASARGCTLDTSVNRVYKYNA
jgi:hypothetical protein